MEEIKGINEIPLPLRNYAKLLIEKKPPYYFVIKHIAKEMEFHYRNAQKNGRSEIVYTINPRQLAKEIDIMVQKESKLTTTNICRTILAFFELLKANEWGKDDDFWITTTTKGRKNYHFRVNQRMLNAFAKIM